MTRERTSPTSVIVALLALSLIPAPGSVSAEPLANSIYGAYDAR